MNNIWRPCREFSERYPGTTVAWPLAWHMPMDHYASFIHQNIIKDEVDDPCVLVACYSYGCGWGFQQLSKYLEKWSIDVRCVIMCDPVYRPRMRLLAWRTWINNGPLAPKIKIRKNVNEVYSFYQRENKPQAHELVAMDSDLTDIHDRAQLHKPHEAMDDHPHFRQKVLDVFGDILERRETP